MLRLLENAKQPRHGDEIGVMVGLGETKATGVGGWFSDLAERQVDI